MFTRLKAISISQFAHKLLNVNRNLSTSEGISQKNNSNKINKANLWQSTSHKLYTTHLIFYSADGTPVSLMKSFFSGSTFRKSKYKDLASKSFFQTATQSAHSIKIIIFDCDDSTASNTHSRLFFFFHLFFSFFFKIKKCVKYEWSKCNLLRTLSSFLVLQNHKSLSDSFGKISRSLLNTMKALSHSFIPSA